METITETIKSSIKIEDPILQILSTGELLSFHTIQQHVQLSNRKLQRRLKQLIKEGKIKRYRSFPDTRRFCYMLAGECIVKINGGE